MVRQVEDAKCKDGMWKSQVDKRSTHSYGVWSDMMQRCRKGSSSQSKRPTYEGCETSEKFSDFQSFTDWYVNQVGYGIEGYSLDKDILVKGNKLYSENTCVLVPYALNNFLIRPRSKGSDLPCGVSRHKATGKYQASLRVDSAKINLGLFTDVSTALEAYIEAKRAAANLWCEKLKSEYVIDPRVIEALKSYKF